MGALHAAQQTMKICLEGYEVRLQMTFAGKTFAALDEIQRAARYDRARVLIAELDSLLDNAAIFKPARDRVIEARDLSLSAHFRQKDRPDGQPYVNHPLEVTLTIAEKFGLTNPNALIAALLHDSVEDQPSVIIGLLGGSSGSSRNLQSEALGLIGAKFGSRVAEMVGRLTNPNFHEMIAQAQLRGDAQSEDALTIQFYKEHFLEILEIDPETFLIKLADFSQNAFALGNLDDGPKKDWLRAKYGPVILATAERLEQIIDEQHPLASIRNQLVTELKEVYTRDYLL